MKAVYRRIVEALWAKPRSAWSAWLQAALQIAYMVARDFLRGQLTLRATGLVYTTLLSLVPFLAASFSILKAFGVHKQFEPLLGDLLEPLGPKGAQVTETIIGFVDNLSVGVLGAAGFVMLFYTAVSMIHKAEVAFNEIWHVTQGRPLMQRFSHYLTVALFGPVLIVAAMGIIASVTSSWTVRRLAAIQPVGTLLHDIGLLVPYLLLIVAFTLLYFALPNTRVRIVSALAGGAVAALLWQAGGWLFASFVAGSAKYTAIYAGFAIVIVAMIWIYYCWLIVLLGATVAFYHQHPEQRTPDGDQPLSISAAEQLALRAATDIGQRFRNGDPAPTTGVLARDLTVPIQHLEPVIAAFRGAAIVQVTANGGFLPARAPDTVTLDELLDCVRRAGTSGSAGSVSPVVAEVIDALDETRTQRLAGRTWNDLLARPPATD